MQSQNEIISILWNAWLDLVIPLKHLTENITGAVFLGSNFNQIVFRLGFSPNCTKQAYSAPNKTLLAGSEVTYPIK